jgi:ketosteroid isomerase-like protein
MSTADAEIRTLVTRWVDAVQARDLEGILRQHDPGIVMFDVPPPYDGIRGIAAYRDSWGPFFEWQRDNDGTFELVDLDVTAGTDVAFARALVRCGTPAEFEANPDNRLRITIGLHKVGDQWLVLHEHHSFPML